MADQINVALSLRPNMGLARKILLVAGEESGDIYAGRLCSHLFNMIGGVKIEGIGGPRMRAAGAETFYDITQMSSVGVASMLGRLRFFIDVYNKLKAKIETGEYDAVILIDYPDFNMRIAKVADKAGLPVFYYVCPQFWAWRRYRLRAVRKYVDMMVVVFPFEEEFYKKQRINAHFVGHPILDEMGPPPDRESLRMKFEIDSNRTLIGLFPGSRIGEVTRMFPRMLDALKIIRAVKPVKVVVGCARSIDPEILRRYARESGEEAMVVQESSLEIMNACDFLICKSGTSTLQAVLAKAPMVIVYRSDFLSYTLAKCLAHVKWAGLPNLLAGREIVPELLQGSMTARNIAKTVIPYLLDLKLRETMKGEFEEIITTLGEPGAAKKAARLMVDYMAKFRGW